MNVRLDHVRFAYSGSLITRPLEVFRDLSLQIHHRECTGILGPEGSGKSTLLGLIAGILRPAEGVVHHDGIDLWEGTKQAPSIRGTIGMSTQFPDEQFSRMTVADEFPPDQKDVADESLHSAGLDPAVYRHRSPFSLSLGESRMLALALVLAQDPDLVLLDVPTSGLDRSGFLRTLRAIQRFRARGKTLVIASHDVVFLRECASTVLMLQEGTVAAEGNAATVLTDREKLVRMGYGGLSVPGASPWDPAPQSSLSIRRSLPQP